ncbi:Uma2 family endonuclease [Leptospira dzoumogneensis]|uniref:Uma2 family endonuclease n=1 Tax=Leptospira dzoumogneensis TaxID=2484904 RepID=A0A4Z1AFV0_9LEPT|nr:Uma2 family endonuclease [Leptospira dzoumogneensis]TGM95950.1 Uma2 family endonuclease [Leptospira dzoumogneensis]
MTNRYAYSYNRNMFAPTLENTPRYHKLRVDLESYKNLEDDGFRYDMVEGVLYVAPSPFYKHNSVQGDFIFSLRTFLKNDPLVKIISDVDVFFPDGGDVLRPDISLLLPDNSADTRKWIEGVPDLIAEVLSFSTKTADLGRKANRYLKLGVKEYWVLDPDSSRVEIWENKGDKWILYSDGKSRLFPGFQFGIDP